MVNFVYRFDYDEKTYTEGALLANAKMHEVADFYVMPHLKALAATKFLLAMTNPANWKVKDFLAAVTVFYAAPNADRTVREAVISAIADNHRVLVSDPEFEGLLSRTPELGKDLALATLPSYGKLHTGTARQITQYRCLVCQMLWSYPGLKMQNVVICPFCESEHITSYRAM